MKAPQSRRLTPSRPPRARRRRTKAWLAELRRQCRLANKADKHDNWEQFVRLRAR